MIHNDGVDPDKSAAWLAEQNEWMRSMLETHPSEEDAFWRHLAYIMAQFDGLYDGYVSSARPDWVKLMIMIAVIAATTIQ